MVSLSDLWTKELGTETEVRKTEMKVYILPPLQKPHVSLIHQKIIYVHETGPNKLSRPSEYRF